MTTQEAKVRLRLDTREAKAELASVARAGRSTAGAVAGTVRGALKKGFGLVGAGAAFGTGVAAVRGATQAGIGDVVGESFGRYGAELAQWALGDFDERAKAAKLAREETIAAFGAVAGETNRIPPGARQFFDQVKALRETEERGRELFERDAYFRGPEATEIIDRVVSGIGEAISNGVSWLADQLRIGR